MAFCISLYSIVIWVRDWVSNASVHEERGRRDTGASILKELGCFDLLHDTGCTGLKTRWTLSNAKGNDNVSIEIGEERGRGSMVVHSLLYEKGVVENPAYGWNEMNDAWVKEDVWTFEVEFELPQSDGGEDDTDIVLSMEKIDTFGTIEVDGVFLRNASNMHRTYHIQDTRLLHIFQSQDEDKLSGVHTLSITLYSAAAVTREMRKKLPYPVPHTMHEIRAGHYNLARKSAVDFGWDFAPAFVPAGLLGPIRFVKVHSMCHVLMEQPVIRQDHVKNPGSVLLDIDVWFRSNTDMAGVCGSLSVDVVAPGERGQRSIAHGTIDLEGCRMICAGDEFKNYLTNIDSNDCLWKCPGPRVAIQHPILWRTWDQGNAEKTQPLYSVHIQFKQNGCTPDSVDTILCPIEEKMVKIGLRSFSLVRRLLGKGESFFFKLNGEKIYSKGSNLVPLNIFRDQIHEGDIPKLIWSAKNAHFNTIRVWGGGEYLPDAFYDQADEAGILIWQEFAFACALYPVSEKFLVDVSNEIQQQTLRIANHPSVVLYGFNNENENAFEWFDESIMNSRLYAIDYHILFIQTIREVLLRIDSQVQYVDSSPSNGIMRTDPAFYTKRWGDVMDEAYGDVHFYEYGRNLINHVDVFPKARFISEFGFMSLPSWRTYKNYVPEEHLADMLTFRTRRHNGLGELSEQMKYHFFPDSCVAEKESSVIDTLDWESLRDFMYLTQLQQGLIYRSAATAWRRAMQPNATMGFLYWQFADIGGWSGPSWSSLDSDFGWKVSHYFVRDFFAPIAFIVEHAADHIDIFVSSHVRNSRQVRIKVDIVPYNALHPSDAQNSCDVSVNVESHAFDHVCRVPISDPSASFIVASLQGTDPPLQYVSFLEEPKRSALMYNLSVAIDSVEVVKANPRMCPHHTHLAMLKVSSTAVALFVTLESTSIDVHFVDNAVTIFPWKAQTFRACINNSSSMDLRSVTIRYLQHSIQRICPVASHATLFNS